MEYKIGEKYTFDVKEIANANGNQYYIINAGGSDCYVKMYEFQKGGERPRKITCIFKAFNSYTKNPIFKQDVAPILAQLYEVGKVYEFKVKKLINNAYWIVEDGNGFNLYLKNFGNRDLYENQVVKCRVKSIQLVRVELELVTTVQIDYFDYNRLLSLSNNRNLRALISSFPEKYKITFKDVEEQYMSRNALWVINAIETIDIHLAEWLTAEDINNRYELLNAFQDLCIQLLEKSGYFRKFSDSERMEYQLKLSNIITHTDDFIKACKFIHNKQSERFIAETLDKLNNSGYIYNPEENMRVVMCIFTLDKDAVQEHITRIFDIVIKEHANKSFMTLFSNAFVQMLESYIVNESAAVNRMFNTEDVKLKTQINEMIKAIAILLLLKEKSDFKSFTLYHSMLYRYTSLIATKDADKLLDMAFGILFAITDVQFVVTWEDISKEREVNFLCGRLLVPTFPEIIDNAVYAGKKAMINVNGDSINISPLYKSAVLTKAFSDDLLKWHNISIWLNDRLANRVGARCNDIDDFQRMWNEIDHALFEPSYNQAAPKSVIKKKKTKPAVDDEVFVRITEAIDAYTFECEIDDELYEGHGVINLKDIVGYNLYNISPEYFRGANGNPLLFSVKVKSIDNEGNIIFSMREFIADFLKDELSVGTETSAKVTSENGYYYVCITTEGYTISISKFECKTTLRQGDIIDVMIEKIDDPFINASFISFSEAHFDIRDAFKALLDWYGMEVDSAKEVSDEENDNVEQEDNVIPYEYAIELIHLVDTHAMVEKDYIKMYNYLALAKVMCHIIDKYDDEEYFEKRMELVKQIKYFEINKKINEDDLNRLLQSDKRFIDSCPDIKSKLTQLELINSLGKNYKNGLIWNKLKESGETKIAKLAKLVLSYNLLDGLNAYDLRKSIIRQIFQIMDLTIQLPKTTIVATEDEFTELKSSMVYPADNHMQPDPDRQIGQLVEVVCSFMNSKGGTLYVGVNNIGTPVGLQNDFIYMNKNIPQYDEYDMRDKLDLLFRNKCKEYLGVAANSLITSSWVTIDDKSIYKVEIEPSKVIVSYKNSIYVRQGTSSWPLSGEDLVNFRLQRRN